MTIARCTQAPSGAAAKAAASHRATVPVLETVRLRLRAPTLDDLPGWTAVYTSPEAIGLGGPHDAEQAWTEFSYYTACWMLHGHGLWSVERRDTGALVGFVLLGLEWGDDEPELGWLFLPDGRGQGYAAEAATAARDWGLGLLDSFVSYIDPENTRSANVAEKTGAARDRVSESQIDEDVQIWRHRRAA